MSVNGCFKRPVMEESGEVITSAPIFAQSIICIVCLIEAAKISVLKPKLSYISRISEIKLRPSVEISSSLPKNGET